MNDAEADNEVAKLDGQKSSSNNSARLPPFIPEMPRKSPAEQLKDAVPAGNVFNSPLAGQHWNNSNSNNSVSLPYNVMLQHHLLQAALVANMCSSQLPGLHQQGPLQQVIHLKILQNTGIFLNSTAYLVILHCHKYCCL